MLHSGADSPLCSGAPYHFARPPLDSRQAVSRVPSVAGTESIQ